MMARRNAKKSSLLKLPAEVLHLCLLYLADDVKDIIKFSQTCKAAHDFCQSPALWQDVFFETCDGAGPKLQDSRDVVLRRAKVQATTRGLSDAPLETYETIVEVLRDRVPWDVPRQDDDEEDGEVLSFMAAEDIWEPRSANELWIDKLDTRGLAFVVSPHEESEIPQHVQRAIAHLQTLMTPNIDKIDDNALQSAREVVYERSNCSRANGWGPFLEGDRAGETNWKALSAISIVMAKSFEQNGDEWSDYGTSIPRGVLSTCPGPVRREHLNPRDWAGVEDWEWRGTYQFLDFTSYTHYVFHRRRNMIPSLEGEEDQLGNCLTLEFTLLPPGKLITPLNGTRRVRAAGEDDDDDPNDRTYSAARRSTSAASRSKMQSRAGQRKAEEDDSHAAQSTEQQREPLHFKGVYTSDGSEGHPNRSVRGTVRMTKDGEIHWQWIIKYSGVDQWLLNGIQVGGARSRYGIIGYWSPADHDEAGPHGPFHYWPHYGPPNFR